MIGILYLPLVLSIVSVLKQTFVLHVLARFRGWAGMGRMIEAPAPYPHW